MPAEIYIEALLVDKELADQARVAGEIDDAPARLARADDGLTQENSEFSTAQPSVTLLTQS